VETKTDKMENSDSQMNDSITMNKDSDDKKLEDGEYEYTYKNTQVTIRINGNDHIITHIGNEKMEIKKDIFEWRL